LFSIEINKKQAVIYNEDSGDKEKCFSISQNYFTEDQYLNYNC